MREIEFRAWIPGMGQQKGHMEYNPWVSGEFETYTIDVNPVIKERQGAGEIWEQYTGLKDKNGKKIFEGDIVKNIWHSISGNDIGSIWRVWFGEYDNGDLEYGSPGIGFFVEELKPYGKIDTLNALPSDPGEGLVLLGNIHENSNLLEASSAQGDT